MFVVATFAGCTSTGTQRGATVPTSVENPTQIGSGTVQGHAAGSPPATTTTTPLTYDRSCEKTAETQSAMNGCAGSELSALQKQLQAAVSEERTVLSPALVDAAEAAFERYESSECDAAASPNQGGSIYPLIVATCGIKLTVQRIEEVRADIGYAREGTDSSPWGFE